MKLKSMTEAERVAILIKLNCSYDTIFDVIKGTDKSKKALINRVKKALGIKKIWEFPEGCSHGTPMNIIWSMGVKTVNE